MQVSRSPSIRSRLALLVLGCLAPALAMMVLVLSYDYHRKREHLMEDSLALTQALAGAVDRELAGITASLHALSTSPHLSTNDLPAFYTQAQEVLKHQIGDNIVLSNGYGTQYLNTLRPLGAPIIAPNQVPRLKRMAETGKPMVSDLFIGPVRGRPVVAVGVPVKRNGKLVYCLSTGLFADHFAGLWKRQIIPDNWVGVILDASGTIVGRTHEMDRFIGQKASPDLLAQSRVMREGSFEGTTLEGTPVITVFSHVPSANWTVAIGIPKQSLTDELWQTFGWLIFTALALLAISLAIAWMVGGRIAASIRGLTRPALALGAGEDVVIPPLHLKEAEEVAASLEKAAAMLNAAQHRASHDALTGLANRALFKEIVDQQLALCQRNGARLSILYLDLDGFKEVNDHCGHATGDRLLRGVAKRLKTSFRESDIAARLGGDEFAIVLTGTGLEEAIAVAEKLVDTLSAPYDIDDQELRISASIGVAGFPDSAATTKDLLQRADQAMYEAKAAGKRRVASASVPS